MKTLFALFALFALSFASHAALADGFAPWATRPAVVDPASAASTALAPTGFAPWRERMPPADRVDATMRLGTTDGSGFRPWYMPS